MEVLIVTREFPPTVIGGVGYHSYNLARRLVDTGHSVTVLTSTGGDHVERRGFDRTGMEVVRLECRRRVSPRIWFDRAVREALSRGEVPASPDVIHSHEFLRFDRVDVDAPAVLKIHYNIGRKFEFLPFDQYPPVVRSALGLLVRSVVGPLERNLARDAFESASGVIFVSDLARRYGDDGSSGRPERIIHNGVDLERFRPGATDSRDESFLFVGGTQTRKGFDTVFEAFSRTNADVKVVGADAPPGTTAPSNVEFVGRVEQSRMASLYRDAAALVHPARYEPFGNVVLESLACGTPVIVSDADHCGVAELLDDDVAITVDPDSPDELREAVTGFAPSAFDAAECRSLVEQYTWDRVADETVAFARSLME